MEEVNDTGVTGVCVTLVSRGWTYGLGWLDPGVIVLGIFNRQRLPADTQGVKGVEHDRELVGPSLSERLLDTSRMRAVRHAIRMQRDGPVFNPLPTHELGAGIVQYLV